MTGSSQSNPFGSGNEELAAMFESMSRMMRRGPINGSVDWHTAREQATKGIGTATSTSQEQTQAVRQASDLADLWLDQVTTFTTPASPAQAGTARGWLDATFESWQRIVEPVADGVAAAMSGLLPESNSPTVIPEELLSALPEEMRDHVAAMLSSPDFAAMTSQVSAMAHSMGATMFGSQFGTALANMASEVCSTCDVGIPLAQTPLVLVANVELLADGLGISSTDTLLFVTLRELAHQRLFACAPWLGSQIMAALHAYATGVRIDSQGIQTVISRFDPTDTTSLDELMSGGIFSPQQTPEQVNALRRLEALVALVEGWVEVTVHEAIAGRLSSTIKLEESFRRRRAAGGPAERLFAGLVGLEIRPRRIREAAHIWQSISSNQRDALWGHPDLLPSASDLDDAQSFVMPEQIDLMKFLDSQEGLEN